ncbi:hypothetical protein ACHAXT_008329 [Thalassiosira profunda]
MAKLGSPLRRPPPGEDDESTILDPNEALLDEFYSDARKQPLTLGSPAPINPLVDEFGEQGGNNTTSFRRRRGDTDAPAPSGNGFSSVNNGGGNEAMPNVNGRPVHRNPQNHPTWNRLNTALFVGLSLLSAATSAPITLVPAMALSLAAAEDEEWDYSPYYTLELLEVYDANGKRKRWVPFRIRKRKNEEQSWSSSSIFASHLTSVVTLVTAFGKFINGALVDVAGARRLLLLYGMCMCLALLGLRYSYTTGWAIACCAAVEFFSSITWPAGIRILGTYFRDTSFGAVSESKAGAMTVFLSVGMLGGLLVGGKAFAKAADSEQGRHHMHGQPHPIDGAQLSTKNMIAFFYCLSICMCYMLSFLAMPFVRRALHLPALVLILQVLTTNEICPLCCEELDLSDKQFYPCKCGYQVCMWCWHRIKETESGLCPACRTPYGDDPHAFSAVDMEDVIKANKEKAAAEKKERERLRAMREQEKREKLAAGSLTASERGGTGNFAGALVGGGGLGGTSSLGQFDGADLVAALGSSSHAPISGLSSRSSGPPEPPKDRSTLAMMRVIRRNLVYAVGLPPNIASENTLRKAEYFGQYGKISKIVINRSHNPGTDPRRASASVYVTFAHKEDTLACILALDGFYHDGRNIRASYGTSKYCSAFIKNVRCNNPDCTYLHHMGDTEDTFTKQEIQAGYVTSGRDVLARQQQIMAQQAAAMGGGTGAKKKVGCGGPSGTGRVSKSPTFPPPSFDEPLPKKRAASRSAASIVAGIGVKPAAAGPPPAHTTLTPLTGLKRAGSMPISANTAAATAPLSGGVPKPRPSQPLVGGASDLTPAELLALDQKKEAAQQQQQREMAMKHKRNSSFTPGSPSHSSVGSSGSRKHIPAMKENGIGGPAIGAIGGSTLNMGAPLFGSSFSGGLGGTPIGDKSLSASGSGILGGQPLTPGSQINSVIGSSIPTSGFGNIGLDSSNNGSSAQSNGFGGSGALFGGNEAASKPAPIGPANPSTAPGGDVGGMSLFGANQNGLGNSGSSALASMLGIDLPTGSGSLRESSVPFSGFSNDPAPVGAVGGAGAVGGLNSNGAIGAIGGANKLNGVQPIGASGTSQGGGGVPLTGFSSGNNDVALLQSLLPGVNITSGNAFQPAAPQYPSQQPVGVGSLNQTSVQWNQGSNSGQGQQQQDQRRGGGNIW